MKKGRGDWALGWPRTALERARLHFSGGAMGQGKGGGRSRGQGGCSVKNQARRLAHRPSGLEKVDLEQVRALASLGLTQAEIGLALKVSERTIERWNKDRDFCRALKEGKAKADAKVARALYESAIGDRSRGILPNVTACIFWLKNRQPDRWRDRRDNVMGTDGSGESTLRIEVVHV
jgi:transcriptional regulator with XRE-family HTH domain